MYSTLTDRHYLPTYLTPFRVSLFATILKILVSEIYEPLHKELMPPAHRRSMIRGSDSDQESWNFLELLFGMTMKTI